MDNKSLTEELKELGLDELISAPDCELMEEVTASAYISTRPDRDVGH